VAEEEELLMVGRGEEGEGVGWWRLAVFGERPTVARVGSGSDVGLLG
jgi:hypothetical protein